jgi:hypothetical protein
VRSRAGTVAAAGTAGSFLGLAAETAFARAGYRTLFATDCSRFNFQGPQSGFAVRLEAPAGALHCASECPTELSRWLTATSEPAR